MNKKEIQIELEQPMMTVELIAILPKDLERLKAAGFDKWITLNLEVTPDFMAELEYLGETDEDDD